MDVCVLYYFVIRLGFIPLNFIDKDFNEVVITYFLKFHNGHLRMSVIRIYKRNVGHFCKENTSCLK